MHKKIKYQKRQEEQQEEIERLKNELQEAWENPPKQVMRSRSVSKSVRVEETSEGTNDECAKKREKLERELEEHRVMLGK